MARFEALRGKALYFLCLAWFVWFMNFSCRAIFSPIMPLLEDEFGVTHARATAIFTCISLGYSFSLFFSGLFARLLGFRKSVVISAVASTLLFSCIAFVKVFEVFYVLGFALGLTLGLYLPSMVSLLTEYYDEKVWGRVIAIHDSGASLSATATPFIALSIMAFLPWRGIFIILGMGFAVSAIILYLASHEVATLGEKRYFLASLWKDKRLWIMGTLFVFGGGVSVGLYLIIPLYLVKELSLDVSYANTIFGISRIGAAVVAISAGFLVDRFSLKKTLSLIVSLSGILTIALGLSGVGSIKVLLFVQAVAIMGFFPVALVAVSRLFDQESRSQAIGFAATFAILFGAGIIPYLLGVSGDLLGFGFGICVLGILTTLSSGLLYFLKELK
jgi:NNP family nitrate/nitrite transporter-like MFS transporter